MRYLSETRVTSALGGSMTPADEGGRSLGDALGMWQELLDGDLYVILDQAEEYFLYHGGENGRGSFATEFPAVVNDSVENHLRICCPFDPLVSDGLDFTSARSLPTPLSESSSPD